MFGSGSASRSSRHLIRTTCWSFLSPYLVPHPGSDAECYWTPLLLDPLLTWKPVSYVSLFPVFSFSLNHLPLTAWTLPLVANIVSRRSLQSAAVVRLLFSICRRVVIDSYRYRNRLLWSAQSGRERSGHQARTGGRQTAESAEARVEDIQDADGWTGRTVDDLVWQAGGLQRDGNRSARPLAGRPLQTVQSPVFPQDRSAHS